MKNSKFVFDKFAKLFEQGLVSSRDIANELMTILKSKRDEIVFKMKLTSKDEFEVLSKRVESLEKKLEKFQSPRKKKTKRVKKS
jgi:BMFP domain-containing protein YqiC